MRLQLRSLIGFVALVFAAGSSTPRDDLDTFVMTQMARRHISGLSLAIIQDGRIVEARAYGATDSGGGKRVDTTTLFQAGSISKSVSALGALHLVEQHKLDLDSDVNATLKTWKVPPSQFTATKPVTLRGLLSHTAGLTVHGFPGYAIDAPKPTLVQVLDSSGPANTAPIRVDAEPGSRWNYSGGGYTVMQQMMLDVTGKTFPEFMRETVLAPLGMLRSTFEQPPAPARAALTAAGHYPDGSEVKGRWHVYPEMAAAGLWTTPSDLARFAIEVQRAYAGRSSKVISQAMAKQMLTNQKDMDGLGVFLQGAAPGMRFNHNGRDEGFDAMLTATVETSQGVVIMTNANDNSRAVARIQDFVAKQYHWPNAPDYVAPTAVAISSAQLNSVAGRYEMQENQMLAFVPRDGRLFTSVGGYPDEELLPLGNDRFASADRPARMVFIRDASGAVTGLTWSEGGTDHSVPRIGPLVAALPPAKEDTALTSRVQSVLSAMGRGGAAIASMQWLTVGARKDFGTNAWPPAADLKRLSFISAEDVSARNLRRHGSSVARILYYRMTTAKGDRILLVHLTSDGLVTDVDDVDE
jgi:CubicO group peptidase (beta-lactamase class C family)